MRTQLLNLLSALSALAIAMSSSRANADLIFDFEDATTQGWSFAPSTFLISTQGLFFENPSVAVFGFDNTTLSITLDLTGFTRMVWNEFDLRLPPGSRDIDSQMAFVLIRPGQTPPFDLRRGTLLSPTNPSQREFDLSGFSGVHTITIQWDDLLIPVEGDPEVFSRIVHGQVRFLLEIREGVTSPAREIAGAV